MNSSNRQKNNEINRFIQKTGDTIRTIKAKHDKIRNVYNNTPLQIKILNIVVPLILTYIFTVIKYNLTLSIIFTIITFIMIFIMSKMIAIIYLIFYIIIVTTKSQQVYTSLGSPILQTDIVNNGSPYNCQNKSLIVPNNNFEQEVSGGYFSYSFWLYINGNNNSINNNNNWNTYRYNEWKSVFYRGNPITSKNLETVIQFPGIWLTPVINDIVIIFNNGLGKYERIELDNVEFNTWINYVIVFELKSVSVYINGLLDRTLNLEQNIINMNGNNLYISSDQKSSISGNGGFAGYIAELTYYSYALNVNNISNLYSYYKKIIQNYQNNIISKNTTSVSPTLITNDDYIS
jgi:hypothetical protein